MVLVDHRPVTLVSELPGSSPRNGRWPNGRTAKLTERRQNAVTYPVGTFPLDPTRWPSDGRPRCQRMLTGAQDPSGRGCPDACGTRDEPQCLHVVKIFVDERLTEVRNIGPNR